MSRAGRIPVAPRPFRDELLSSWLARVACRYGLQARDLTRWWGPDSENDPPSKSLDVIAPHDDQIRLWARPCGIDPMRVRKLSLIRRHPGRSPPWFLARRGPRLAVCFACFDGDRAAGRDSYLRADWMLAERCACPAHRRMLDDRCPSCNRRLHVSFRMRDGHARPICDTCETLLTGRGGEGGQYPDAGFVGAVLDLQKQIGEIATEESEQRRRLERRIAMLWAPLDRPGAARPVLALWFDQEGWRCPFEVRHAVGFVAPFGQLSARWRTLTLIVLRDLFGPNLCGGGAIPAAAARLFRRVAPLQTHRNDSSRAVRRVQPPTKRPPADYACLAYEILAHPDWIAAEGLSERRRQSARARLMDKVLAKDLSSGNDVDANPQIERKDSPPIKREFERRESVF